MLIDYTYFKDRILIPGLESNLSASLKAELLRYIQLYEQNYLRFFFGPVLYNKYVSETDTGGTIPVEPSRWYYLFNGTTYTDKSGNTVNWQGLIRTSPKYSPIANYVYVQWKEEHASIPAASGEGVSATENTDKVNPVIKIVAAWNDMVAMNEECYKFLTEYYVTGSPAFPEFTDQGYSLPHNSCFDYMLDLQAQNFYSLFNLRNRFI